MNLMDKWIYKYMLNDIINNTVIELIDTTNLDKFVLEVVKRKQSESHHTIDSNNESKRWRTGMGGELALEKLIGEKFVDLSVGDSKKFHQPDLKSLNLSVGIKTVEYGKYPVIFKTPHKPEIIIIKVGDNKFSILGLATVDILRKYQDDNKILSPALRARGTKTGFTGLHKLKPFKNINELREIVKKV